MLGIRETRYSPAPRPLLPTPDRRHVTTKGRVTECPTCGGVAEVRRAPAGYVYRVCREREECRARTRELVRLVRGEDVEG